MLKRLFVSRSGHERLLVPALAAFIVTLAVGFAIGSYASLHASSEEERASSLTASGKFAAAEAIYVQLLHERPNMAIVLAFLDNHARAITDRIRRRLQSQSFDDPMQKSEGAILDEEAIDAMLAHDLPPDVSLLGRFWRGVEKDAVSRAVRDQVLAGAKREPPLPWHNHLLGREAEQSGALLDAAGYYEREGMTFPERASDVDGALNLWMNVDAWDHVRGRLQDARVWAAAGNLTKYRFAVHERDWKAAVWELTLSWKKRWHGAGLWMSAVSALAWAFMCARLGKLGERPKFRIPLYVVAFGLGVASVIPTMFLIAVEESRLKLIETGDVVRDMLFYVFGVGLREEASKALLFLPLVPILRRWGDKLDVLVAGAMVGLGFAAEENIDYVAQGALHSGLARFLTANFLHMAMTGIFATALYEFLSDRERYAAHFLRVSLFVVGLHGAYDFFLSHEELGGSYFAMTVFLFLTKPFLDAVDAARRRADKGISVLQAFVLAIAVVTGVTFVYATHAVGPQQAALMMTQGLVGVAILLFFFVRSLRAM
ncbi:PrsW family glutamic-type intramembrane protease [Pendulispora albinea]|uniref:PrsW family intramembrane metalloprotease n=1 Tax=Pendulispora albinea TaxID=2741071 RepID=A0ABZ2M5C4_9BACT